MVQKTFPCETPFAITLTRPSTKLTCSYHLKYKLSCKTKNGEHTHQVREEALKLCYIFEIANVKTKSYSYRVGSHQVHTVHNFSTAFTLWLLSCCKQLIIQCTFKLG